MKKLLLDTHIILWIAEDSQLFSDRVRCALSDVSNEKYVSIVSAWEVAIKIGTSKLNIAGGLPEYYRIIDDNGFFTLSVERKHLRKVPTLPKYHKDPFDRLLVSTAIAENMTLITADENIHKYDVSWLW
jgi:PIN domain nuclease of toxin-antitoxin system